jgi:hypothetical protein
MIHCGRADDVKADQRIATNGVQHVTYKAMHYQQVLSIVALRLSVGLVSEERSKPDSKLSDPLAGVTGGKRGALPKTVLRYASQFPKRNLQSVVGCCERFHTKSKFHDSFVYCILCSPCLFETTDILQILPKSYVQTRPKRIYKFLCCVTSLVHQSLHADRRRELVHGECSRSSSESLATDLVNYRTISVYIHIISIQALELTNEVLGARRVSLALRQVVEEQLHISAEGSIRAVGCGREEAVHLHRAVVSKVQIKFESRDRDCSDWGTRLGDRPDTSVPAEPGLMLARYS